MDAKKRPAKRDKHYEEEKKAAEVKFKELQEAFEILSTPEKKQRYAYSGLNSGGRPATPPRKK